MASPQVGDAPIEPRVGADACGGITRSAAAAPAPDSRLDDWVACHHRLIDLLKQICEILYSVLSIRFREAAVLRREQRGRRLKEQCDCFINLSVQEAKTPFRNSIQALLRPASIRVNHRLIQIALPCSESDGALACLKSFVPIFDMAKRLCSSASPNMCQADQKSARPKSVSRLCSSASPNMCQADQKSARPKSESRLCSSASPNMCQADQKSARPKSESPKVGTISEFSTNKSIDRRNGLTKNKPCPSDPDFSRAEHDINEGRAKTSAAWVAATAAPHHATGNRDLLSGFIMEHDDLFVHAADGVPRKVLARGAVITDTVILPDVWFVPGLTGNLVSVSQLAELDHSIGFGHGECCIRSTHDGKMVGKGRLQKGGLYVLDFLKVPLAL